MVLGGTTLVVSPLVALMKDQLNHLPEGLPAAMLWRGQPKAQAVQVLQDLAVCSVISLFLCQNVSSKTLLVLDGTVSKCNIFCSDGDKYLSTVSRILVLHSRTSKNTPYKK